MSYATDDAEMSRAWEILFLCRGKLSNEIRRERAKTQPDAQSLADLEQVISQLRDEIDAVTAGNRAVTTRVPQPAAKLTRATDYPRRTPAARA